MRSWLIPAACAAALVPVILVAARARQTSSSEPTIPLVTGKALSPEGEHALVGSFPTTIALSPDHRYAVVSSLGTRARLTAVQTATGQVVSTLDFQGAGEDGKKRGLYFGLAFAPTTGRLAGAGWKLYASRGSDDRVSVLYLSPDGRLSEAGETFPARAAAGLATSADGGHLFVASSTAEAQKGMTGHLSVVDLATKVVREVPLPGYTLAVAAQAQGPVFVTSEQSGAVHVVDPEAGREVGRISTGAQPMALLWNREQSQLFVANAGSDTVSVIDPKARRVVQTILVRPVDARGIPGATPSALALSPDEETLFIALADYNAVAVVETKNWQVRGYIPVGWYPTAVAVSADGNALLVANAKGTAARNPNGKSVVVDGVDRGRYIQSVLEGTLARIDLKSAMAQLPALTKKTLVNNRIGKGMLRVARQALKNPGIEHVIYVIKENRTYDQVLGDLGKGDGDPSLTLFGREITPNLHALAERFVLLDNFYCSAEVSGDGWSFSTQGMASEYVERNVAYGYSGRSRPYDYEGTNNGIPVERLGITDVGRGPGGYLWDKAAQKGVSYRNYGMFIDDAEIPRRTAEEGTAGSKIVAAKTALARTTCFDFRPYDLTFADSEAWVKHGLAPAPKQMPTSGSQKDPARIATWRREYEAYCRDGGMPKLMLVRLGRDHTAGTSAGQYSPRAMVADNDYAVGQLVETVSRGPYWKKTAIFVIEDDAQNGYDHVDAHRSIAFVVSPFVPRGSHDSRFFNTDSVLRTMQLLLGLDPMTLYDATAPAMAVFGARPENDAPYTAILPARAIVGEVNAATAYRSRDSARLIDPRQEESLPDEELNEILWRSMKGATAALPPHRYGLRR